MRSWIAALTLLAACGLGACGGGGVEPEDRAKPDEPGGEEPLYEPPSPDDPGLAPDRDPALPFG